MKFVFLASAFLACLPRERWRAACGAVPERTILGKSSLPVGGAIEQRRSSAVQNLFDGERVRRKSCPFGVQSGFFYASRAIKT